MERLETERLVLRRMSLDDVDHLVALDSDPDVMRFINGGNPTPRADIEKIVSESLGHRWTAFDRSTNEFVGWLALRPTGDGEYELGYRLRRDMWAKGFATEGSRALVAAAFGELGARRVWAQTMSVNAASRRVMEHCGLHYVRTFHLQWPDPIEGTESGDVEYEILRHDWEATGSRARI